MSANRASGTFLEKIVLDYRKGGSSELALGERLDDDAIHRALDRAKSLLLARGDSDALRLIESFSFELFEATNSFTDDFIAAIAFVSPHTFAEYRTQMEVYDLNRSNITAAAGHIREVLGVTVDSQKEVRFIVLVLLDQIVRGVDDEYRISDDAVVDAGGFARIHKAFNSRNELLALKRLFERDKESVARLRREIQEQSRINHPSVMPIIDYSPTYDWFVMPMADENLAKCWTEKRLDNRVLLAVLRASASGLAAAHALGLVHRDVSPRNILRIRSQWVVADWGTVRRPKGLTTVIRTQGELGTHGFAAPELFQDAHRAGPPADVYALGRIAAWALTRKWPEQNVTLLPDGPWRQLVREATQHEAAHRPQTMADLTEMLDRVERDLYRTTAARATKPRAPFSNTEQALECLEYCLANRSDVVVYLEALPFVSEPAIIEWCRRRGSNLSNVISALERHTNSAKANSLQAGEVIAWLRIVAALADFEDDQGLLEDAATALVRCEAKWQLHVHRDQTRMWLETLRGTSLDTVARVIGREPGTVEWLGSDGWSHAILTISEGE